MSVEKMEQYKEYKKHRKEILRKQKRKEKLTAILGVTCCVLILGTIGFLIYQDVKPDNTKKYVSLVEWDKYIPDDILGNDEEEGTEEGADTTEGTDAADDSSTDSSSEDTTSEGSTDTTK